MTHVYAPQRADKEARNARDQLDRELIGELGNYVVETPSHGIPRPAWFNPQGVTLDDLRHAAPRRRQRR